MVVDKRQFGTSHQRSNSNQDVMRLTNENFKLTQKLNELQEKLQVSNLKLEDTKSVAQTSVFKRISQRTLNRENKVKLMYGQPISVEPTGFVEASFKDNKVDEWAESKRKKAALTMTEEEIMNSKGQMAHLSSQLAAEKQKRLEIEQELLNLRN